MKPKQQAIRLVSDDRSVTVTYEDESYDLLSQLAARHNISVHRVLVNALTAYDWLSSVEQGGNDVAKVDKNEKHITYMKFDHTGALESKQMKLLL